MGAAELSDEQILQMLGAASGDRARITGALPPDPNKGLSREAAASAAAEEPNTPMIGAGREITKLGRGMKQGFLGGANLAFPADPDIEAALAGFDADRNPDDKIAYDAYAKENPFATGLGEALPSLAFGGGALAQGMKAGAMGFLKEGNLQERGRQAGVDAVATGAGAAVGNAVSKYVNPNLSPIERKTLEQGRARGINPRLSQVMRSPDLEGLEDWSGRMMAGRSVMGAFENKNARGLNRVAAESIGKDIDNAGQVGPEVFAQAKRDMQAVFQEVDRLPNAREVVTPTPAGPPRVYDGIPRPRPTGTTPGGAPPIVVGQDVEAAAIEALRQQSMQISPDPSLTRIAEEAIYAFRNGGRMTGESYQNLYHELTNASQNAFTAGEPKSGRAWAMLRDALDQSADNSLRKIGRGDLAERLQTARQQWANLKMLETGRVVEGGNVSPPRVAQAVRTNNPDAFRTGRNTGQPLDFIARWAELFPGLRAGSQTAERNAMSDLATGTINLTTLGIPAATVAKITTSPFVTAGPARYGGTAAGKVLEGASETPIAGSIQSFIRRLARPQTP